MSPFTYRVFASGLHDQPAIAHLLAGYLERLAALGGRPAEPPEPASIAVVATGGTEHQILDWWKQRSEEPAFLLAHPGHNSLPAALEALARIHQLDARGAIIYLRSPADDEGFRRLDEAVAGLQVWQALHATSIGLLGSPSDWLVASTPPPETIRRVWGPTIVDVPLDDVYTNIGALSATATAAAAAELTSHAAGIEEPTPLQIEDAAKLAVALDDLVETRRLDAVAVRCFDLLEDISTSGCYALSRLNDAGIVAGCEGDPVSTIGILWSRLLTGETPWMANPAQVDVETNSVLLAHCTVPRSVVDSYRLRSHFESDSSVGIEGVVPPGPVTLVRIGGADLDRLWLAEGEIRPRPHFEGLCRTQIDVQLSRGSVDDLLTRPLGNHVVVVAGHHADALQRWWETFVA